MLDNCKTIKVDNYSPNSTNHYDIKIGNGILGNVGELIKPIIKQGKVIIISDENVAKLHLLKLKENLTKNDINYSEFLVHASEKSKSTETAMRLSEAIISAGVERDDTIVTLGGGVISDLGGFIASIILRGIKFIAIPTTLLSQVDASVGGKTGINSAHGKNLIGSFYNPSMVISDTETLKTLPTRELHSGYAEVVKYGILGDAEFFNWLCDNCNSNSLRDVHILEHIVYKCSEFKADIVAEDLFEKGKRSLLNLGHTFAHAIEKLSSFDGSITHGEAVAAGMVEAAELSQALNFCDSGISHKISKHLQQFELPISINEIKPKIIQSPHLDTLPLHEKILELMAHDKKVKNNKIGLILLKNIGEAFASWDVSKDTLNNFLQHRINSV